MRADAIIIGWNFQGLAVARHLLLGGEIKELLIVSELNYSEWEKWTARWSNARIYCVFNSVGRKFYDEQMGTPRFNRMVEEYYSAWAKYLKGRGIDAKNVVLLLVDEPATKEQDERIVTWAKAIHASKAGFKIYEDPRWSNLSQADPEMFEQSDILCPSTVQMTNAEDPEAFMKFFTDYREKGKTLWLYSCHGPSRLLDPITYHRGQEWRAFAMGAEGTFYWALGCGGGIGDSWHPFRQPGTEYSPFMVSPKGPMDAKHSESLREGVQDYEYLCMLRDRIAELKAKGVKSRKLAEAEKLLAEAPARALRLTPVPGAATLCECDNCKPEIAKHGLVGMQLIVANRIAEILVDDYPDIRLTPLVYGNGKLKPGDVKAHPNVVLFLAPIGARYNNVKMLVPLDENKDIVKAIDDCFVSSDKLYFWDYLETDDMPFPGFDQFAKSVRFLADRNVSGYFADVTNGGKSLSPLKKWLYCQLLWNPAQDIERLIPEFVNAFYGAAAPEILEYITLIRKAWRRFEAELKAAGDGVSLVYSSEELQAMTALFEKALKAVEGDAVHTGRVAREYIPLIALKLAGNPVVIGVEEYGKIMARGKALAIYMPPRSTMKSRKWVDNWERKLAYSTREPDPMEYSRNTVTVWKPLVVNGLSSCRARVRSPANLRLLLK